MKMTKIASLMACAAVCLACGSLMAGSTFKEKGAKIGENLDKAQEKAVEKIEVAKEVVADAAKEVVENTDEAKEKAKAKGEKVVEAIKG